MSAFKVIPWLGSYPTQWSQCPIRMKYEIRLGKMLQSEQQAEHDVRVPYLKAAHVQWERVETADLPEMWASPSDLYKYEVRKGDLLVCEGGEVGRAAILGNLERRAIIQNALHRIRSRGAADERFLLYLLRHAADAGWFDVLCNKATIAHLTVDKLGAVQIPFPPPDDQRAIADFLDWKTAAIDELLRRKGRLVELLKEKRQALITQAVTRGLNPEVPLKDSGVRWLGRVPQHWTVTRVKHTVSHVIDCPHSTPEYSPEGEFPAVRTADVERGKLHLEHALCVVEKVYRERVTRLEPAAGDILYSREGERFGMAALVPPDVRLCLAQRMMLFRAKRETSAAFLMWALNSDAVYQQVKQDTVGATSPRINIPTISNAWLATPPSDEQKQIAAWVDNKVGALDRLESTISASIGRLREFRKALISSAVAGRLDVRSAEAA